MPRRSRVVFPACPHHLTQRGNHRERVFFSAADQRAYLDLLKRHAARHAVEVAAYCLMPNHVHFIVVPSTADGLHRVFGAVHGQYARRIHRQRDLTGHCWQSRFFSSPLDENYFINAVRYVELNPVRARFVAKAEDYLWSSAAAHCGVEHDSVIQPKTRWPTLAGISDWPRWLAEDVPAESLDVLRRHARQNLPCGSEEFVSLLESHARRSLRYRTVGREPDENGDSHL